jgi:UDP-GlcNAc:undecaprenyl-phosphate/decaprenyl-phosphate GlcNAc-1-phosphate transferase
MTVAVSFLTAFALSLILVPVFRRVALRAGLVARPKNDRWHRRPTALLGGVAIAVALFGSLLASSALSQQPVLPICAALVFVLGLTDDLISLKPSTKLVAQIALASIFLASGQRLNWTGSITLDSVLTIIWVVGVTNAFNLLDNMDGLCAGIAIIIGSSYLVGLFPVGQSAQALFEAEYTAALVGAVLGFLVYNFHPASVFMGDSGSLLIGLSFAGLMLGPIPGSVGKSHFVSIVAAPVLVLLIPIFDTSLVTVSRMLSGRPASVGGRDHSSHRLVAVGLSERAAVRVLWLLAALGGAIGLAARHLDSGWAGLVTVTFLLAMVIFAVYLAGIRVYEDADAVMVGQGKLTPLVTDLMYKKRAAEVILDLCLVSIAYYAAYRLRFEGGEFADHFVYFQQSLPIVVGSQMLALFIVGGYRGVWQYFGLMDAVVFGKGVLAGTVAAQLLILYIYGFEHYSRTVFIIYAVLLVLLLTTSRGSFRLIGEYVHRRRQVDRRLAIYGAGDGGSFVVKELAREQLADCKVVGFVDDDPRKARMRVQGYPVLGGFDVLLSLIETRAIDVVVVSISAIDVVRLRTLEARCLEKGIALSRLNVELKQLVQVSGEWDHRTSSGTAL